jgi:3-dehydroquinate dehydratase/shikimate dehydrogenase
MKIILSLAPRTMDEAVKALKHSIGMTDLVEVRIDGLRKLDLRRLLHSPRAKVIITNRRSIEDGSFNGSLQEQLNILSEALQLGAEYVDIEASWGIDHIKAFVAQHSAKRCIVSHHDFRGTPHNLTKLYTTLRRTGASILKIVTMAHDITDTQRMYTLLALARQDRQHLIAFCMGERGEASRILGGKYRSFATYGAHDESHQTASGQLTFNELKKTFHVDTLNSRTKVFGLLGNPVSHSKGIYYHNLMFNKKSVNAIYLNFLVDDVESFFKAYNPVLSGLSVTMPFKQAVIPLLDRVDESAHSLGAVNIVLFRRGKSFGTNTDLPAIQSIIRSRTSVKGKHVLILGTGAIARTMAYGTLSLGARITITGRSTKKAQALASELGCASLSMTEVSSARDANIIMNGTSVGMESSGEKRCLPKTFFRNQMIVFDAVYSPPMTRLLFDAKAAGCTIISGMELFKKQAALQSKLFLETLA